MIGALFASLASACILLAGFVEFSTSSYYMLRADFERLARENSGYSTLMYADLLVREGSLNAVNKKTLDCPPNGTNPLCPSNIPGLNPDKKCMMSERDINGASRCQENQTYFKITIEKDLSGSPMICLRFYSIPSPGKTAELDHSPVIPPCK